MNCRICGQPAGSFATATILGRHSIEYFLCDSCRFVQTQEPTWLEESYSRAIALGDIGLVQRNLHLQKITSALISMGFNADGQFLDYGGGYGLFVRLMRDQGFDFRWEDPFCENLFATGFERVGTARCELLTAFEVFEHLPDPHQSLQEMLTRSDSVFFTTQLLPDEIPKPQEWWYYTLETGQHVSLYSRTALSALAAKFGLNFYTNGKSLHLFTRKTISPARFRLACSSMFSGIWNRFHRRESLIAADHELVLTKVRASHETGRPFKS